MKNVNLLPGLSKGEKFQRQHWRQIVIGISILSIIVFISALGLILFKINLIKNREELLSKKETLQAEVKPLLLKEAEATNYKLKAASLVKIQKARISYSDFLTQLYELIPNETVIEKLSLDINGNLSFLVNSKNVSELELFSKQLASNEAGGKIMQNILFSNIVQVNNNYQLNVTAKAILL